MVFSSFSRAGSGGHRARRIRGAFVALVAILAVLGVGGVSLGSSPRLGAPPPDVHASLAAHITVPLGGLQPVAPAPAAMHPLGGGGGMAGPISPGVLRSLYDVNGVLNGSAGLTPVFPTQEAIGVLVWGNGFDFSDIDQFLNSSYPATFPRPHIIPVPTGGAPAPGPQAWNDPSNGSLELTLDIEWALSAAPGATIYAIYGPASSNGPTSASIEQSLAAAMNLTNLTVLSLSWGEPQGSQPAFETQVNADLANLTARGVTVLAAAGDDGGDAYDVNFPNPCQGPPDVDFPAASPYALAVGGTNLLSGPATVWNLSGGGFSSLSTDPIPSWQRVGSAAGEMALHAGRGVPDVAASAVDDLLVYKQQTYVAYGTSFASPFWAGVVADLAAEVGHPLGLLAPTLYQIAAQGEIVGGPTASAFVHATQGSNCVTSSSPGWNPIAGWGSPNATSLALALLHIHYDPLSDPVSVTIGPGAPYSPGKLTNVSVTVPAGSPLSGGSVQLVVLSALNDSPVLRLQGVLHANGTPWRASFPFPANTGGRYVNISALVSQGNQSGVGSVAAGPQTPSIPPQPPAPLFQITDLEILFGLFILAFLLPLAFSGRRRQAVTGPPPPLLGAPPPPPPGTAAATQGATYVPFCWRCGQTLQGNERECPNCKARFG